MNRFNVNAPVEYDPEPEGYRAGYAKLHPEIGARTLFGGLFELPPGQSGRPYHYESAEEWLLVLAGPAAVRHAIGEDWLLPRRLVSLPARPAGPQKSTDRGDRKVAGLPASTPPPPAIPGHSA